MFARYAYAPNALGYCGPPLATTLRDGSMEDVRIAATKFSGAWPYLQVLSKMTGIPDPLDHRLVESYWLGGGVGAELDPGEFVQELLAIIGPQARRYWPHLSPELVGEAAANHCFHVFGVYPWSRLLSRGLEEHPLSVLDNCRITTGTVLSRDDGDAQVLCRKLVWDGRALTVCEPSVRRLDVGADGYSAVPDLAAGDVVAMHWGRVCGRLRPEQVQALTDATAYQLRVTNQRLART